MRGKIHVNVLINSNHKVITTRLFYADFIVGEISKRVCLELSDSADISRTFSSVILPAKRRDSFAKSGSKRLKIGGMDRENFIPYKPTDAHTEQG